MVLSVAKKEGFKLDNAGADLIAILGDGSFRDTQGTLQKVLSGSKDKNISSDEIEKTTGAPSSVLVNDVLLSIDESSLEKGLKAVSKAVEKNIDMKIFLKLILHKMRFVLLLKYAKDMSSEIKKDLSEEDFNLIIKMGQNSKINSNALKVMLDAFSEVSFSYIPQLPLELALVKIIGQNG
jgi:DNA polymerase III gamma/tau subunit